MPPKRATTVLVVDDEELIRDFLSRLLSLEGLEVTTAEDGFRAIEIAKKEKFDIIFLDIRMPKMDGVEAFKKLKKITPNSKFIMITGYSMDELLKRVEGEHIEAFITKPFDIHEIVNIIEDFARQKYPDDIVNILVVEAEDAVSGFFKKLFKAYDISTARTGKEALEIIERKDFDLVLADIMLEDMNGVELYSKIREMRPHAEIILVTGDAKKTEGIIKGCLYQQIKNLLH